MAEPLRAVYRAGQGEPLVLLHGFTATWRMWLPVLADLVERYEVIAPTLAGHAGGPEFPASTPISLTGGADLLEQHLDELGVSTAHLVGNSMGGALAIELARRGRARSVVALAPGGGWSEGDGEGLRLARYFTRMLRLARASEQRLPSVMRRPRLRHLAFRDVMRHGELVPPAEAIDIVRSAIGCSIADRVIAALRTPESATLAGLEDVAAPVLLAWPQHDRLLPIASCAPRLRREIPGAEFRLLSGCGHAPMWDDARLVAATVREWVDRHSERSRAEPAIGVEG